MSQENVEIVERAIDGHNRLALDAYDELFTPDFEMFPAMIGMFDRESFRGRDDLERYFEIVNETWEESRVVGEAFRDLGDRVLVTIRLEGRGRGSGVPVTGKQTVICDLRDGKIRRMRAYLDHGEALRAAGLCE
jgi:ketosteroid isomerase-like protein